MNVNHKTIIDGLIYTAKQCGHVGASAQGADDVYPDGTDGSIRRRPTKDEVVYFVTLVENTGTTCFYSVCVTGIRVAGIPDGLPSIRYGSLTVTGQGKPSIKFFN